MKASAESARLSRQREVDRLERSLRQAEAKVVDRDKVVANLQKKIDKGEDSVRRKQIQVDARHERKRNSRDQAVDRDLSTLAKTTSALVARLTDVEEASLSALTTAVVNDPVKRQYDVFLPFPTPYEVNAGKLRDEL